MGIIGSQKKQNTDSFIYESPDGGKTVYGRRFGDPVTKRTLVVGKERLESVCRQEQEEKEMMQDILVKSKSNKALQNALDHVKLIYNIVKESTDKNGK